MGRDQIFTPQDREGVYQRLLELLRRDPRLTGVALIGSTSQEGSDRWSDIDVGVGVARGAGMKEVTADWTRVIESEFGVLHQFDLPSGATLYRVFLLPKGLEIDLSFSPEDHFAARGPAFRLLSGRAATAASTPPDVDELVGLGWLYAFHARASLEREKYWRAEYFISAVRDQALTLACLRMGEETAYARGFDRLPPEVTTPMKGALVHSLDEPLELRRAISIAVEGLLQEISFVDPQLATALQALFVDALHK